MKKRRFSERQIIGILKQGEAEVKSKRLVLLSITHNSVPESELVLPQGCHY
jgi:hypothetical protein